MKRRVRVMIIIVTVVAGDHSAPIFYLEPAGGNIAWSLSCAGLCAVHSA